MTSQTEGLPSASGDTIDNTLSSCSSSTESAESITAEEQAGQQTNTLNIPRLPQLRSISDPPKITSMTPSSTPLGMLNNARRPPIAPSLSGSRGGGGLPQDMQAKMRAFQESRQGTPLGGWPQIPLGSISGSKPESVMASAPGLPGGFRLPPNLRPQPQGFSSSPVVPISNAKPSLSARRNMRLPGGLPGAGPGPVDGADQSDASGLAPAKQNGVGSMFNKFSEYVDTKNGTLKFAGKAVIHGQGVDFSNGSNFSISLNEVDTLEELGKGNYGTVYKVRHARPRLRRPGLGLASSMASSCPTQDNNCESIEPPPTSKPTSSTTGVVMAMKEIRLELDEAKFAAIIMELDILHRCVSPYIIDFYGAFFQEGAVYICIEFMDGGSIDKLYDGGIPESVLRKITYATTKGLKELKDVHNIIHRDVKPTNILVNTRGQVKICDFGVSGNLVASIAKTNIGCQSYMAPERIAGGGVAQAGANPGSGTYSVQSDIWSLGLTIIECAMGRYPYPPETYSNIFSQLSVSIPRTSLTKS
jgi:mitogen-activated protein kinase kinase